MKLSIHVVDVIVEITTHDNSSISILFEDVFDNVCHPLSPLLLELLISRFEIAVENLNLVPSCRQPHPTEVSA